MPRNPGLKKHQHNNRHENGLVVPGKRVTKQKSNGHLNGSPKPAVPDQPVPAIPVNDSSSVTPPANPANDPSSSDAKAEANAAPVQNFQKAHDSESSNDGQDQAKWESVNGSNMSLQRRSEGSIKRKIGQDIIAAQQMASTILRSCPACDTVALLIVLLALPSMILIIVQALFAFLTLMPPTSMSPIAFLNLFDVFQGSAGSPSLTTMAVMDVLGFGVWVCLWTWAQNFALDLAQIQIAITLGNGTAGKNGGVNIFCIAIVLFLHSVRSRGIRQFLISKVLPTHIISSEQIAQWMKYLPTQSDFGGSPGSASKIGSLFAIHILSQAVMAFVRRRVASTQSPATGKSGKRTDTEASAGASATQDLSAPENSATVAAASGVDYQQAPTPGPKDVKEKGLSAKKRRRQANQVRSKQPFWAALACIKVHVLREQEHNKSASKLGGLQNASFDVSDHDAIWLTEVNPSYVRFESNYGLGSTYDDEPSLTSNDKPFYVKINGARWRTGTLEPVGADDQSNASNRWIGYISGLFPGCTYTCTFVRTENDRDFASVMVKTPLLSDKDLPSALSPAPPRASTQPSSPTSTLKNSIQSAEVKLSEVRNRLTKIRRTHRQGLAKVEKEVDQFNARLKSAGDDLKQRQKLLQAERTIRQTEDATISINAALEDLEKEPEENVAEYKEQKAAFEEQTKQLAAANDELSNAKANAGQELSCVNGELSTITTRKERLVGRQGRLTEQHDRITQANIQGLNEKERKAAEVAAREADQQQREEYMNDQIAGVTNTLRETQMRVASLWREIEALEQQDMTQRQAMMRNNSPLTPEGELPGMNRNQPAPRPFSFGSFYASTTLPSAPQNMSPEQQSSPFLAFAKTLPSTGLRPRSNTNRSLEAMSNLSTDFEDADPIPPMPTSADLDLNGRKSSGSSRDRNNASPAVGVIGTIGGALRSPARGSHSPGHVPSTSTW